MERKAIMPGDRSSKPEPVKLTSFHIVISSFAALAGVGLAAYQAFGLSGQRPLPVNVTLTLPQLTAAETAAAAAKTNAETTITTAAIDLDRDATFAAALKDDSASRYSFAALFDRKPESYVTLKAPDTELNVLVTFGGNQAQEVTAISYSPPPGVAPEKLASVVDVMVLPEGDIGATGRPVFSFSLQRSPGSQTFAIPGRAMGTGVWLRIAGAPDVPGIAVGDFAIIREHVPQ